VYRVEGVGVRLRAVVRVGVAGVGGGFHDRQLVKLDDSLYRPDILVLYSIIMLYNMMIRQSIVMRHSIRTLLKISDKEFEPPQPPLFQLEAVRTWARKTEAEHRLPQTQLLSSRLAIRQRYFLTHKLCKLWQ
jgi:hypothetical protein